MHLNKKPGQWGVSPLRFILSTVAGRAIRSQREGNAGVASERDGSATALSGSPDAPESGGIILCW